MVPATGALQQCVRILPPVLLDHTDGCKPAEEVSTKCVPGVFGALVRSVFLGYASEQRDCLMTACVLCHWIALGLCGKLLLVTDLEASSLGSC